MKNEIIISEKKTFFLGKIEEIRKEISDAKKEFKEAKTKLENAKDEYDNTPRYRLIKRAKNKKAYRNAMDNLTVANSEALTQNFKIIGYILELILFCFLIPMDLIQKMGQWIADGFSKRDVATLEIINSISNTNKKPNILKGFLRLSIIVCLVLFLIFIANKMFFHKEKTTKIPVNNESDISEIELMKEQITNLENTIKELKNIENETIRDSNSTIIDQVLTNNLDSENNVINSEIEKSEIQGTFQDELIKNEQQVNLLEEANQEISDNIVPQIDVDGNHDTQSVFNNNSEVNVSDFKQLNEKISAYEKNAKDE